MKFQGSIDINAPLEMVTNLFADKAHMGEYQDGFVKKDLTSGEEGKDNSVSKIFYKTKKHEIELTETVVANKLPHSFEGFYHHKHMDNTMKCTFTALSEFETRYETEIEYTRINWVMPKLFALLFPSMYRKPAQKWMNNFKVFVEKQVK